VEQAPRPSRARAAAAPRPVRCRTSGFAWSQWGVAEAGLGLVTVGRALSPGADVEGASPVPVQMSPAHLDVR
jgi:hypothetical protein